MDVILPHQFKPRSYQKEVWDDFFIKDYKRFVNVWHRRCGKGVNWFNIMIAATQKRVGNYVYALPLLTQAREVIWEGINDEGKRFLDYIPTALIDGKPNASQMAIRFKNGSRLRLGGSDHYNTMVGGNPVFILFDEYALQNPLAWDYLRPILLQNNGVAAFTYTPRGGNHGFDLYEMAKNNPDWSCSLLTCEDTFKKNGERVFTDEMIQSERDAHMSEDMIEQEYYCSFSAALVGSFYSKQFKEIERDNGIMDFSIDRSLAVDTYWDLGVGDSTSIWLVQKKADGSFDFIYYYENEGYGINHYINIIQDIRAKLGITYKKHYAPHDVAKRDFNTGKTTLEYAQDLGLIFERVPRIKHKEYAIEASRFILPKCRFHQTNCKHGIRCLKEYRHQYNNILKRYMDEPLHDWTSHGCLRKGTKIRLKNCIKNIEDVKVGDIVDLQGIDGKVINAGYIKTAQTLKITLSDGTIIEATPEHKFFTTRGVVTADKLCKNDILFTQEHSLCKLKNLEKNGIRKEFISNIMEFQTWKLFQHQNIQNCMPKQTSGLEAKQIKNNLSRQERLQQNYVRIQDISMGNICKVYDLTIAKHHCYFANGILVSNSDAFSQFAQTQTKIESKGTGVVYTNRVSAGKLI